MVFVQPFYAEMGAVITVLPDYSSSLSLPVFVIIPRHCLYLFSSLFLAVVFTVVLFFKDVLHLAYNTGDIFDNGIYGAVL